RRVIQGAVERGLRGLFLVLSNRPFLGRLATRLPFTRPMVARFVAGETLAAALPALRRLDAAGYHTTLDILGESVGSEEGARTAATAYVEALHLLADHDLD